MTTFGSDLLLASPASHDPTPGFRQPSCSSAAVAHESAHSLVTCPTHGPVPQVRDLLAGELQRRAGASADKAGV